jgi:phospholipid/cholesterol/gamma-HCH transport system substrate-binding protein
MVIKREVKTGILVVVALAMLLFGLNFLKGVNIFSQKKIFYAVYTDVHGIVPSNPVLASGFHIGQVKDIRFIPGSTGKIVITLQITNTDIKIPKNSIARIVTMDLLGGRAVDILLGDSPVMAQSNDTLTSNSETSLKESVNQQILPLKRKAEELISSIDSTVTIIQGIFTKSTRQDLTQSIVSIRNSLKHLENTSENIDILMAKQREHISSIFDKIDEISTTLAKNSKQINKIINNLSTVSDTLAKSHVKSVIDNADSTFAYTASIFSKINKGKGTVGMLANDTALYMRLSRASEELTLLIKDLREHPKRYVHFSVFGKKD